MTLENLSYLKLLLSFLEKRGRKPYLLFRSTSPLHFTLSRTNESRRARMFCNSYAAGSARADFLLESLSKARKYFFLADTEEVSVGSTKGIPLGKVDRRYCETKFQLHSLNRPEG